MVFVWEKNVDVWLFLLNKLRDAAECVYVCDFAAALALICIYRSDTCRAQSRNPEYPLMRFLVYSEISTIITNVFTFGSTFHTSAHPFQL